MMGNDPQTSLIEQHKTTIKERTKYSLKSETQKAKLNIMSRFILHFTFLFYLSKNRCDHHFLAINKKNLKIKYTL